MVFFNERYGKTGSDPSICKKACSHRLPNFIGVLGADALVASATRQVDGMSTRKLRESTRGPSPQHLTSIIGQLPDFYHPKVG